MKLDAVGYGFVIPVFFVASGVRLDLDALTDRPSALARVPLFVLALLLARSVPSLLFRRALGTDAGALSVVVSPPILLAPLRSSAPAEAAPMQAALPLLAHRPMGTQD